jgi:putative hemolysin
MTRQTFSRPQRRILSETFELFERTVNQITVPRTDVMLVQADLPAGQTVDALVAGGHSRAPVCEDDLDSVVGVVHLQDVVHRGGTARDCARPPLALPETLGVLDALRRMQAERQHLAIVIDEHGGSAGILTLEDVLEELVGEIFDEFDPDTRAARRDDDGSLHVVGSFPVHDLPDLGVELPSGPYATIAGLILHRLGRLPTGGETVEVGGWRLTVEEVQGRAISKVWLQATDV